MGPTETERFQASQELGLFDFKGWRLGLQLCYDAHFPELSTLLALQGAQILLFPHASPRDEKSGQKKSRWLRYLPARAYDNTVFLLTCNLAGENGQGLDFAGVALILGPKGETLAAYSGSRLGLVMVQLRLEELESSRASRMGFFRASRRLELYRRLAE